MFLESLLILSLQVQELRDKIEHPKCLTFQTQTVDFKPELKIRTSRFSITWKIIIKRKVQ